MSEEQGNVQNAPANGKFQIQKIYCKDISFESPNAPAVFQQTKWEPDVNVQLATKTSKLAENLHEVVITVTVTAKVEDNSVYLAEVQQAGIFQVEGFAPEQMGHLLASFCPSILFPYAREAISDLVNRGGFPQMLLAPVNFDALYMQHLQKQKDQAQSEAASATAH